MSKVSAPEAVSYAGSATAITSSMTLTEIGVWVGIATAILTFAINAIYVYRKDRREKRVSEAELRHLEADL